MIEQGRRIKKVRQDQDLKQDDFCAQLNLSRFSLGRIERGEQAIDSHSLFHLKTKFGISADWILFGAETKSEKELDDLIKDKIKFENVISNHTMLHEQIMDLYTGFRRDAHPMAIMVGVVGALSAFYHNNADYSDPDQRMIACHRLVSKIATIGSMAYKYSLGQPFVFPKNDLSFFTNLIILS